MHRIDEYIDELIDTLKDALGERLVYIGLQGSYHPVVLFVAKLI